MDPAGTHLVTKTRFIDGLQCPKKLWFAVHEPELAPPTTRAQQRIFDFGNAVGRGARDMHRDGVLIDVWPLERAAAATQEAIDANAPHVFEATFIVDGLAARIDVLSRTDEGFRITEVKASTKVKPHHVQDVAFQKIVAERAGMQITGTALMHVDNTCDDPESPALLKAQDIDADVAKATPEVEAAISRQLEILELPEAPAIEIGSHCDDPYECPFKVHCWRDVPKNSVFTIPRLSASRKDELWRAGVCRVVDLPDVHTLRPAQQRYIECVRRQEPQILARGIAIELGKVEHPIHFLDFETDALPIQRWTGLTPYEKFPFQYSCHVEHADGTIEHHEFLHGDLTDPRPELVRRLLQDVADEGSIVAYNAGFEGGVLEKLADEFPEHTGRLRRMADRLWDLLPVVRANIDHPDFEGSWSIKKVLPVLVPGLTYEGRAVSDGSDAQAAWDRAIHLEDGPEKDALLQDIRAYCELDTFAMVEILRVLRGFAGVQHLR
jgi:hypothetical protein